ncbi:NAD(P)-dependent oxidoreductase [Prauserella alba]|uniref:NAD(P)-binding domain-containing protein n=1 Tax=Prauserella alba TaxID=176898 RepID=A0ABP4G686_9PSEU|nr:NAD(P)-binding domain-containing protein [Prauserella alba]MCP2182082.1 3-hydroxyisobutyrate dehydrogenase [Prauserella alba]
MSSITKPATAVSVLGVGAIGSAIAQALLAAGITVTVWNRSPGRVDELTARGAEPATSSAEAASASPLVIVCLTDYTAVDGILDDVSDAIAGRTIVTLSTGSPRDARHAAQKAESAGAAYLDGGVQTEPAAVGTAAAVFLYSGSPAVFEEHRTTLETLGTATYLGADPAAAAVQDLALFGLWYDAQVGYLRALEAIRSVGIDVEAFAAAAATQLGHVVHATADTAREVTTSSFPRGPADLTEHAHVLEQLTELRHDQRLGDGGLDDIHGLVQQRIALGHGPEGLNSIVE